jgi:hypothetical protein
MPNKKQTSLKSYSEQVIQLFWKLENKEINIGEFAELHHNLYEQAKAMHKEEIEDSFYNGMSNPNPYACNESKYYHKTFGEDNG